MMNIQELATVMHYRLPIKLFILNNGGYLTIKQTQQLSFDGRYMGVNQETGLSFPDFLKIAEAHRMSFVRVGSHDDLPSALEGTLAQNAPAICEIMMDHNQPQIMRAVPPKKADGTNNYNPLPQSKLCPD